MAFAWVLVDNRWVNWEEGLLLILVSTSDVDLLVTLLEVEVERSWPLQGSDDNDTVGHWLANLVFVFIGIAHKSNYPWLYFLIL